MKLYARVTGYHAAMLVEVKTVFAPDGAHEGDFYGQEKIYGK